MIKKAQDIVISLASATRGYTENNDDYCISSGGTGIVPLLAAMIEKLKDSTSDMLKDVVIIFFIIHFLIPLFPLQCSHFCFIGLDITKTIPVFH